MKKTLNEQIDLLLDKLMALPPEQVEAFFLLEWKPFVERLPSDELKTMALEKLWQRQVDNLAKIAAHIPGISRESFEKIEPQLQALVSAGESLRLTQKAAATI